MPLKSVGQLWLIIYGLNSPNFESFSNNFAVPVWNLLYFFDSFKATLRIGTWNLNIRRIWMLKEYDPKLYVQWCIEYAFNWLILWQVVQTTFENLKSDFLGFLNWLIVIYSIIISKYNSLYLYSESFLRKGFVDAALFSFIGRMWQNYDPHFLLHEVTYFIIDVWNYAFWKFLCISISFSSPHLLYSSLHVG